MKTLHIVPHVHWDREWYFTAEESKVYFSNHLDEVLTMLEEDNNYPYYILDGQTSILEDYFEDRPEDFERVKKLASKGKLVLGPWYTQSDEMIVQGESLVRNLYYGYKDCSKLGSYMKIGYLPDSFGQCAQMPMILNGFDIPYSMFWRGVSKKHGATHSEFYWESDDGSKVLVQMLPLCYALGRFLPNNTDDLKKRMDAIIPILFKATNTNDVILPNGHDQMPIQKDIHEIIEKMKKLYPEINIKLNSYENVMDIQSKDKELKKISGEFLDGYRARIHRSIYSSRMDLKIMNAKLEHKLTNNMEPILTMAYLLGFHYPQGLIEKIWRELLKNHAHDSLGCCCGDKVHNEIEYRFKNVEERSSDLMNFSMRMIAEHQEEGDKEKLLVFNSLPYEREEVITAEVTTRKYPFILLDEKENEIKFDIIKEEKVDATTIFRELRSKKSDGSWDPFIKCTIRFKTIVPSFGYQTFLLKEAEANKINNEQCSEIEDSYFKISVNVNGTLKIYNKKKNVEYNQVCALIDDGDDGDEYEYSPPENDWIIKDVSDVSVNGDKGIFSSKLTVNLKMNLPSDLQKRKEKISDVKLPIKYDVELVDDGLIRFKVSIDNNVYNHRLRMLIPSNIASSFSYANQQFGEIKRPVVDEMMEVWEKECWEERPDSIYPMIDYVYLKNDNYGLALISNGSREYEIIGEDYDTIALTLFRSVGICGKSDLIRRPGRLSGITLETPDAQLNKRIEFDFALYSFDMRRNNVSKIAKEYLTPIISYNHMQVQPLKVNKKNITIPMTASLIKTKDCNVTISAIKKCESEDGIVIRVYNTNNENAELSIDLDKNYKKIIECNLKEEHIKELEERTVKNIKKNQVRSIIMKNIIINNK